MTALRDGHRFEPVLRGNDIFPTQPRHALGTQVLRRQLATFSRTAPQRIMNHFRECLMCVQYACWARFMGGQLPELHGCCFSKASRVVRLLAPRFSEAR